jgi:hypothetical protein
MVAGPDAGWRVPDSDRGLGTGTTGTLRSYGIFELVPNYPAAGQWAQAFKPTSGAYDRRAFRCH